MAFASSLALVTQQLEHPSGPISYSANHHLLWLDIDGDGEEGLYLSRNQGLVPEK